MREWTLEDANADLAKDGYPPIRRLPADEAALASWRRIVDAQRELERTGELSDATVLAVSAFCHCLKCPTYPRGEKPAVYCLTGKSVHASDVKALHCKCPTCAVYEVGGFAPERFFCLTGTAKRGLAAAQRGADAPAGASSVKEGGVALAARKVLEKEIEDGNAGKRLPERLMAPPQYAGKEQRDVQVPEKVPGT